MPAAQVWCVGAKAMDPDHQLKLLHQISLTLLAPEPLAPRLTRVVRLLCTVQPWQAARITVLHTPQAWSVRLPLETTVDWPRRLTAQLLRRTTPLQQQLASDRHYLGWPIRWQQARYGALELLLDAPAAAGLLAVLQALVPLLATAIALDGAGAPAADHPPTTTDLALLGSEDQRQLAAVAAQLQAPVLLQPLLACLLRLALERSAATRGAIHLVEPNAHGLHLLTFELADRPDSVGRALTHQAATHDLAKVALANRRAMLRQHGAQTQFAAPLIHAGRLLGAIGLEGNRLEPRALAFVQRLAEIAAPAVLRAQFYQELADARTHLQQVFDELPTGLALIDNHGALLRVNPAWWRLWALQPVAETITLVPWDMLPHLLPRLSDPLAFADLFTRPHTEPTSAVVALQSPWQELRLLVMPVRNALGVPAGFLLAADDVTREREVDRLKSEFVSVVSHELRTPLTSILGYTELLLAREFDPVERREFIETIYKEAEHLSNLVEDLLNVSRIDAGKIKLDRWVIALPRLVRELVAQLNAELDVERHRLLLDVPETLPPIYADRDRVRQILGNLLSNAIKYSPEGGEVVLQASVLRQPPASAPPLPPEPALLISVRDQGIGIPPHELGRIFERFYRVDNSNTRRIGGTGLGLAITKALVELHGGRIWAESTPGEGSTFFFTLPIATEMLRTRRA